MHALRHQPCHAASHARGDATDPSVGPKLPTLFATIDAVKNQRELAVFRFRATNEWKSGTHSRSYVKSFYGAGTEHEHVREFTIDADHPAVLVGTDNAPLPVEIQCVHHPERERGMQSHQRPFPVRCS